MGVLEKIRDQFLDVIQYVDKSNKIIVTKFRRESGNDELKQGTKVIVREGQAAVFLKEGQMTDILFPGTYTLDTENLPVLSTLNAIPFFFASPVIADLYFVSIKQFIDNKWATKNPIMKRDRDFNMVRIRAFGKFAFRISDVVSFMKEIFGTRGIGDAAGKEGGLAGLGAGMALGHTMAGNVAGIGNHNAQAPLREEKSRTERLRELKSLLDEGILTQEEFETEKREILKR